MKINLRAAGRIRSGPERTLIDDYMTRASGLCRSVGIASLSETEIDVGKAKSRTDETLQILGDIDRSEVLVVMDERGKTLTSRQMASAIARWRDDGQTQVTFVMGAADGFEPSALPANKVMWSLGAPTWPHKLARVMLTEQLYRAISILAGQPYHRD